MKSTGVVRKIDELGRIVLPSELRRVFGIREGDELEISVDGDKVILQKRQDLCLFCGAAHRTHRARNRNQRTGHTRLRASQRRSGCCRW